jgi:hypothetical protein
MKTNIQIKTVFSSNARRGMLFLLVLLLVAYVALEPFFPHRVTPASASAEQFSAERAMAYLTVIASEPHPQRSPAQKRLHDYLITELTELGLEAEVQRTIGLENVIARLHGRDPTGAEEGYVGINLHRAARIAMAAALAAFRMRIGTSAPTVMKPGLTITTSTPGRCWGSQQTPAH